MARRNGLVNLTPDVQQPVADIVFVHGLQGDGELTWTHPKYGVYWPQDLLPLDVKNARILSWHYDSRVTGFWTETTTNDIDSYASNLCGDLTQLRGETSSTDRPILFVAHSLGGLVCSNALVLASHHPEKDFKSIAESIRGIVFFGTPHQGADAAKWARTGLQFFKLDGNGKTTRDLKILERESVKLNEVSSKFKLTLRERNESDGPETKKIGVVCFYEEFDTRFAKISIGKVVDQASATLDAYRSFSVPEDHRDMVRFKEKGDTGYTRVSGVLKTWVADLARPSRSQGQGMQNNFYGHVIGGQQIGGITGGSPSFSNTNTFSDAALAGIMGKGGAPEDRG